VVDERADDRAADPHILQRLAHGLQFRLHLEKCLVIAR
jgi:hypothetical protein